MLKELIRATNIGDTAIVRPVLGSIEQGKVDMISTRGINIITPCGPKFVKWHNVIEIKKEKEMSEPKEIAVTVADGKYTVVLTNAGGTHALRHGLVWRDCTGDNLISALASELAEARDKISAATNCLVCFPIADAAEVFENTLAILTAEEL